MDTELMNQLSHLIALYAAPVHKDYRTRLVDALEKLVNLRYQRETGAIVYAALSHHRAHCWQLIAEGN